MGEVVRYPGAQTDMHTYRGEEWKTPVDPRHISFSEWEAARQESGGVTPTAVKDLELMELAWDAAALHFATLRRVGWLDQKGRVWTKIPPTHGFDGGSLTPLLIDARD
jgi:hypothetical protein